MTPLDIARRRVNGPIADRSAGMPHRWAPAAAFSAGTCPTC